jgi:hypothetical protein
MRWYFRGTAIWSAATDHNLAASATPEFRSENGSCTLQSEPSIMICEPRPKHVNHQDETECLAPVQDSFPTWSACRRTSFFQPRYGPRDAKYLTRHVGGWLCPRSIIKNEFVTARSITHKIETIAQRWQHRLRTNQ